VLQVDSEPKVVTTTCKLRRRGGRKRVKDFGEGAGNDKEDAYREKPQLCGPDSIIRQGNAHVDQQGWVLKSRLALFKESNLPCFVSYSTFRPWQQLGDGI